MSNRLTISYEDIIRNLKLSCQIPTVMEAIATQKIITEAAQKAGIKVSDEELQQEGDRLRFAKKLVKAQDTWAWLKKHHLALDEFEELVHDSILYKKLVNHLFADKVEQFFYEHQLNYVAAVTYEVIFDQRDLALELFYALQEGETSFQSIAREYIQEPELRRSGGYQGTRRRTDFRPEIASAVFAANPPNILKPITTPKGVYLIWVEEIIQPKLDEQLRATIQQELFSLWLKQQIQTMEIITQLDLFHNLRTSKELRKKA
ncbi:peptidylprolyl isomerase [Mastigocladopsis repens]|uniref:peptidylprolyl isomerase n=1 Tax=Mastigocladopsis repens TaxID=221287 RepID=UPI000302205F|nr:peptidylprolyl isomerase [Mastigocladopsis repens]